MTTTDLIKDTKAIHYNISYLLNGSKNAGLWGQTIGTDAYPIPGGASVYLGADFKYTNTAPTLDAPELVDGYYIIDSAADLIRFRDFVNSGVQIAGEDTPRMTPTTFL